MFAGSVRDRELVAVSIAPAVELAIATWLVAPGDVVGALAPKQDELPRLQARHAAVIRFFARIAIRDRDDAEACVAALSAADVRAEFRTAFRRFAESIDILLPEVRALDYVDDLRWLGKIRQIAAARYRDEHAGPDVRDVSEHGLSDVGFAICGLLNRVAIADGKAPVDAQGDGRVRDVAQAISLALQLHTALLDWREKGEVQREMRRTIKCLLPMEIFAKVETGRDAGCLAGQV